MQQSDDGTAASRYEFRIFGSDLNRVAACLRLQGALTRRRDSREIYLLSRSSRGFGVKLRESRLEIKERLITDGYLERWSPRCRQPFPLEPRFLRQELLPALGLAAVEPLGTWQNQDLFLEEFPALYPDLQQIQVYKRRVLFEVHQCRAEYVRLWAEDQFLQSVAVEAEKSGPVLETVAGLGLNPASNTSYPQKLKELVGLSAEFAEFC